MSSLLGAALLTGLGGGVHCVGMCGGFASASASRGGSWPWHLGRFTTYATLGALVGSLGISLPGPAWLPAAIAGALVVYFALRLAGLVGTGGLHFPMPKALLSLGARFGRGNSVGARFGLGLITGLLPCGLVYAALALALAAQTPLEGAAVMVVFGTGTVPLLAGLAAVIRRLANQSLGRRRALAALIAVVGLWSVSMRTAATLVPEAAASTDQIEHTELAAPGEMMEHPPGCPMAPGAEHEGEAPSPGT